MKFFAFPVHDNDERSRSFSTSEIQLSPVGKVFPITAENLRRWRDWWKYVCADQIWLWAGGCFVGMFLNVNLAMAVTNQGESMDGIAAGAFQAKHMAENLWPGFWFLTLTNGFWLLFSTHLGNTDVLVRTVTDILWVGRPWVRERGRMRISRIYYTLLGIFTIWAFFAVHWGHALAMFKILGFVAAPIMTLAAIQILRINIDAGPFTRPHGITIGPDDTVYCVDDFDHTVKMFSLNGNAGRCALRRIVRDRRIWQRESPPILARRRPDRILGGTRHSPRPVSSAARNRDLGLGQSIGHQTMQLGIEKAGQHGVAVVALRDSGHLGRIGDWPLMAANEGFISLHFVNTSGAGMLVAPYGGVERRLSVNPIAAGVPVPPGQPMILDMSAATIAEGKVRVALNKGGSVPEGCLIDAGGNPTCEPAVFYGNPPGAILPIAGHKGFGLSMIIEMLAGALTGGSCTDPKNAGRVANGMLSIILDPTRFLAAEEFSPEASRFIAFVKSSRTATPAGEILMPGEPERRTKTARMSDGIDLDDTTCCQISVTCQMLEIDAGFKPPEMNNQPMSKRDIHIPGVDAEA